MLALNRLGATYFRAPHLIGRQLCKPKTQHFSRIPRLEKVRFYHQFFARRACWEYEFPYFFIATAVVVYVGVFFGTNRKDEEPQSNERSFESSSNTKKAKEVFEPFK